jgi:hypothetical protein
MKTLFRCFSLALIFLLAACSPSPQNTAKDFAENLARGKVSEAKKHATDQTGQLLDMASSMGGITIEPDFKFILVEKSIEGNRAVVRYRNGKNGTVEKLDLVKIDGQWKVNVSK